MKVVGEFELDEFGYGKYDIILLKHFQLFILMIVQTLISYY
jgi:hypothetical protein